MSFPRAQSKYSLGLLYVLFVSFRRQYSARFDTVLGNPLLMNYLWIISTLSALSFVCLNEESRRPFDLQGCVKPLHSKLSIVELNLVTMVVSSRRGESE